MLVSPPPIPIHTCCVQAIVATLHPNATVQHRWGNWFIEGNLTVYNRTEFLFDGIPHQQTRAM